MASSIERFCAVISARLFYLVQCSDSSIASIPYTSSLPHMESPPSPLPLVLPSSPLPLALPSFAGSEREVARLKKRRPQEKNGAGGASGIERTSDTAKADRARYEVLKLNLGERGLVQRHGKPVAGARP
jgi:hypothetical protein